MDKKKSMLGAASAELLVGDQTKGRSVFCRCFQFERDAGRSAPGSFIKIPDAAADGVHHPVAEDQSDGVLPCFQNSCKVVFVIVTNVIGIADIGCETSFGEFDPIQKYPVKPQSANPKHRPFGTEGEVKSAPQTGRRDGSFRSCIVFACRDKRSVHMIL